MAENRNKALTLQERKIIETGIANGSTKAAIAVTLGKEKSTIGKEIKKHRVLKHKCSLPLECSVYRKCSHTCPDFVLFKCNRRDRSPGACNGCSNNSKCRFNKYYYDAYDANHEYIMTLKDSRTGVNLTSSEAKVMGDVVKPLILKGQSPYQIICDHPELGISERTLYNYIEWGVFEIVGIKNIDLRRKTSRKLPKKKAKGYKKRKDCSNIKGRTYDDYLRYMESNENAHVLEMDTVYNDGSNGPFIQTFKFIGLGLMIALLHDEKNAASMNAGVDRLDNVLGRNLFQKYVEVLLTDRGTEFSGADGIELRSDKTRRTRVFYCDPMQSGQKGSLEVNHELLRYILPKETDLRALGLVSQDALNETISHINSAPVESLAGKSPIEYVQFMAPDLWEGISKLGIREIPRKEVTLKPYLLKHWLDQEKPIRQENQNI